MNSKKTIFAILFSLWILTYAFIMFIQEEDVGFSISFINSIIMNCSFAILSLFIRRICNLISFQKIDNLFFYLIHFFLSFVLSIVWVGSLITFFYVAFGIEITRRIHFEKFAGWLVIYGMIQYFCVAAIFYISIYYARYKEKELKEANLLNLQQKSQLKLLKLQINPHFLFNSLNSINALVTANPQLARKMIQSLSSFLNISLQNSEEQMISLQEELKYTGLYLEIEKIRFQDRLEYHEEIDKNLLHFPVPALFLQPLVENSVKHGISSHIGKGRITLSISQNNDDLTIKLSNTAKNPKPSYQESIGIANVKKRLEILYKQKYTFDILVSENLFTVNIQLPIKGNLNEIENIDS